ncbi:MAG TPA: hypothetical protein VKK79_11915 [Candidatus Lokiarchaeia archaeon]|nr:hypothetical protein [Candidatus Lokiarchaeia archaeon]
MKKLSDRAGALVECSATFFTGFYAPSLAIITAQDIHVPAAAAHLAAREVLFAFRT